NVLSLLEKLDIARHDLRPGQIAPPPEFRRSRAGHPRYSRDIALMLNRNPFQFGLGQRGIADAAIAFSFKQQAMFTHASLIGTLNPAGDILRQAWLVRLAESRDGNLLVRTIDRDRFERRVFAQRVRNGTRQAGMIWSGSLFRRFTRAAHNSVNSTC